MLINPIQSQSGQIKVLKKFDSSFIHKRSNSIGEDSEKQLSSFDQYF